MLLRHGQPRAQQEQAESLVKASYETYLLKRLAQILGKSGFASPLVEHARKLGATSFEGFIDPSKALS